MRNDLIGLPTFIDTERTKLRQFQQGDGEQFFMLLKKNKNRLTDTFPRTLSNATTPENAEFWIRKKIVDWLNQTAYCFAIIDKKTDTLIGEILVKNIEWSVPIAEIGYFIDEPYEGKGIMKEVLLKINSFSFEKLGLNKLFLKCMQANTKSFSLAEKCGYRREGIMQKDFRTLDGELVDTFYYGLVRN